MAELDTRLPRIPALYVYLGVFVCCFLLISGGVYFWREGLNLQLGLDHQGTVSGAVSRLSPEPDLYPYPNSRIFSSAKTSESYQLTFSSKDSPVVILNYYENLLLKNGWEKEETTSVKDGSTSLYKKDSHRLELTLTRDYDKTESVGILFFSF